MPVTELASQKLWIFSDPQFPMGWWGPYNSSISLLSPPRYESIVTDIHEKSLLTSDPCIHFTKKDQPLQKHWKSMKITIFYSSTANYIIFLVVLNFLALWDPFFWVLREILGGKLVFPPPEVIGYAFVYMKMSQNDEKKLPTTTTSWEWSLFYWRPLESQLATV